MSFGQIIRILEGIMTIYCGITLAVRPCRMRWDNKVAKVVFLILVLAGAIQEIENNISFKFSSIGTVILASYLFIILIIFWDIHFWQLFAQNYIYWYTILIFHYIIIYACCVINSVTFKEYICESNNISYHWLHILGMVIVMILSLFILQLKNKKALFECRYKRNYLWLSLILFIEILTCELLFNKGKIRGIISDNYLITCILVIWALFSLLLIILIYKIYRDAIHQRQISLMNLNMLQKQYILLQEMYTDKRRQIHDSVHHDVLVIQYLQEGKYDEAVHYLEKKMEKSKIKQKNKYTGISVIDLMLDYKIDEAEQYGINVHINIDVFFCPIEETEMCILLGNLLDNAIDATKDISPERRRIDIYMKTPNKMFILEICNPYEGKRRKIDGHYITTKPDKSAHGLGLDSVERIIESVDGTLRITDDGSTFTVVVGIFKIQGQNRQISGQ